MVENPHPEAPSPPVDAAYRDQHGIMVQCSHCRRVRRSDATACWDWVPAFVAQTAPNCSHGLCRLCAPYYYRM